MDDLIVREYNDSTPYHWVYKLATYREHPILDLLYDFDDCSNSLINCSYLYMDSIHNKSNKICIWHYHTSLDSPLKFQDMQNFISYSKISGFSKKEQADLCLNVDRDSVIDLKYPNALTIPMLDEIKNAKHFVVCDELGNATEYDWQF